jgi:signal transduction histidine kinase
VLSSFIVVIVVVLSAFTLFSVIRAGNEAKDRLKEQGEMLADLLAHGSSVGVFAENEKLLKESAEGFLDLKDVVSVSMYDAHAAKLYGEDKASFIGDAPSVFRLAARDGVAARSVSVEETRDAFEFVRPVVIKTVAAADESFYFDRATGERPEKVIGYVRIVLSKETYRKEMLAQVTRNALIMLLFIISSLAIVYFSVRRVARPLEKLTENVKALGKGLAVEEVPVESGDEIGNLASAFNAMVAERKRSEMELLAYHESLSALSWELSKLEESERRRIATDLHDHIGQTLALSKIKLGDLRRAGAANGTTEAVDEVRDLIDQSIRYTRSLTFELSMPVLYDLGLDAALEWLAEYIYGKHGLPVFVTSDGETDRLSDEMRLLFFKAVRELLMNIVKHAKAKRADVRLQLVSGEVMITVEDDGAGFSAAGRFLPGKSGGFGLFNIRERLKQFGGSMDIESAPGRGTHATIRAPLPLEKPGLPCAWEV